VSFDFTTFVRQEAQRAGIPAEHLTAVEHRAELARRARDHFGGNTPLRDAGGIMLIASLDGIDEEIASADRALGRRVVAQAVADHAAGTLERLL